MAWNTTPSNWKNNNLRRTGIEIIGDVPWSTHFCQFYQTKQDLIDTIIPYIKNGLESNELCIWVTADNLDKNEAEQTLKVAMPDYQQYLEKGAILILPYTEWYSNDGEFNRHRVLNGWIENLNQALATGFEGARVTGDTMWLKRSHWQDYSDYEESINAVIGNHPLIVLCTYSLDKFTAGEVADVVANHEFAMMKRNGKWNIIENSTVKQAKHALQNALDELEAANAELIATEEELRAEIEERKQIETELRKSERRLNRSQEIAHLGSWELDVATSQLSWSDEVYRIFGFQPQEFKATYQAFLDMVHPDDRDAVNSAYTGSLSRGESSYEIDHRIIRANGDIRWVLEKCEHISDESGTIIRSIGMVHDITEQKITESKQQLASETLRILNRGAGSLQFLMKEILHILKEHTGFDAIGLRIRKGDDCPYFEQSGFSDEFVHEENAICKRQGDGSIMRDEDGNAILECTCGLVLSGRTDPSTSFFTEGGSFWTNESKELLDIPIEEDPRIEPRNRCINEGYQSVALVPVRSGQEIIGLLQLNNRRKGSFTPDLIRYFEGLADNIGLALKRKQAEEELEQAKVVAEEKTAQLESFISSMADGVILFDTTPKFLMVNEAALRIGNIPMGVPLSKLNKHYKLYTLNGELVPLKDYPSMRALKGERTLNARFRLVTPWTETMTSISASPVRDSHGVIIGGTLSFTDITTLVEFERYKEDIYRREHRIAQMLQQALIPPHVPAEIGNFRIGVKYQSALAEAEIGGDFYDVFDLNDSKIGVLIGDVTGKGLAAAIRVAEARYSLRSYAYIDPKPSKVMELTNKALCTEDEDESNILTAFFAVIDTVTGEVTYTSAGHEPPVICRTSGCIDELVHGGIPVGITEHAEYTEGSIELSPGDTIVMVTDGITEARTSGPVLFEKQGMIEHLQKCKSGSPDDIASELLSAAIAHADGQLQDDAAVVVVRLDSDKPLRNFKKITTIKD